MKPIKLLFKYGAWIYAIYLGLSLLVILPALNFLTPHYLQKFTGRQLQTDIIVFNPFALALEIRAAALPEQNGDAFLSFDRAAVNLSLASLWQPGIVFDEVALENLYLHVARLPSGEFNFSDMLPPEPEQPPPPSEPLELPGITIDSLILQSQRIAVSDQQREEHFHTHWDGLDVRVVGLSTIVEVGRPYSIVATAESGGRLAWEGTVSIPGSRSEGKLQIENIDLRPGWRFAQPWLNFELAGGQLDLAGEYTVNWADELAYRVDNGQLALSGIDIQPMNKEQLPDTAIQLGKLEVADITVDSNNLSVEIAAVRTSGLLVAGWSEGEQVSLADMLAASAEPADQPDEDHSGNADSSAEEDPWQLTLAEFTLDDSQIQWRSEYTDPPLLTISPLQVRAVQLSWPPTGPSDLELQLAVNGEAQLAVNGALHLGSGDGGLEYQLSDLPLPWFSPNIPSAFNADLTSGAIATQGSAVLAGFAPSLVKMNGAITDAAGVVRGEEQSLTRWDSVAWEQLEVDLLKSHAVLQKLSIVGYSGRLHIYEDGSINTQRVLEAEIEEASEAEDAEAEAAAASGATLEEEQAWTFELPLIAIDDSALDFMDESMFIVFRTVIGELEGDITGLSSDPAAVMKVDLRGSVDGYAPVTLGGSVEPLGEPLALDLGLAFDGLDLVRLSPYSGTYAGYAIGRGTLNLDVHYKIKDDRLEGRNSVVIDQLKLGDKIDSEQAVDLPLGLAIALLTDAKGVIDLDVPVGGNMEDPSFSIGSIVGGAFINLITKAATAPFKLLGALIGSEEDLRRVTFAAGSSELDESGSKKLTDLASAMAQRPGIKLILLGRLHPQSDLENLQRKALDAALLAGGVTAEQLKQHDKAWSKAVAARYEVMPGALIDDQLPSDREQYRMLTAATKVPPAQLKALAAERAVNVKRFLVNDAGVAADRAVIEQVNVSSEDNTFSGVEMTVGS